jgi:putative nucleotidyltransferase with HDIG domain
MGPLPTRTRLCVLLVVLSAAPLPVVAWVLGHDDFKLVDLLALSALFIVTDSIGARGSRDLVKITLGSVTALAALPLVGGWGAVLVSCACAFDYDGQPIVKRLFNSSQMVLAAAASALAYSFLGGEAIQDGSFPGLLLPFVVALLVHCVVNGLLVASIVHIDQGIPMRIVLQGTMSGSVLGYVGYGLFGLLLAVLWAENGAGVGPAAALLLLLPLHVARWAYEQYAEQQRAYDSTVRALIAAVETKDVYTRGHSERVAAASVLLARAIGMREDRVASLRYAGMLHDIGKLGVPTRVLQKTGRLSPEERAAIQLHPVRGLEMVREIEFLDEAFAGIMHHHERLDGMGYPMGLQGDQIPEFARVIAVADAFDSMTTTRSYRGARSVERALEELRRCSGSQFDPPMVVALIAAIEEHGWTTETIPLVPPAQDVPVAESVAARTRHFDHDDPTQLLSPQSAS